MRVISCFIVAVAATTSFEENARKLRTLAEDFDSLRQSTWISEEQMKGEAGIKTNQPDMATASFPNQNMQAPTNILDRIAMPSSAAPSGPAPLVPTVDEFTSKSLVGPPQINVPQYSQIQQSLVGPPPIQMPHYSQIQERMGSVPNIGSPMSLVEESAMATAGAEEAMAEDLLSQVGENMKGMLKAMNVDENMDVHGLHEHVRNHIHANHMARLAERKQVEEHEALVEEMLQAKKKKADQAWNDFQKIAQKKATAKAPFNTQHYTVDSNGNIERFESLLEKGEKAVSSNANAESDTADATENLESLGLGIDPPKGRRLDLVEKKLEAITPGIDKLQRKIEREQMEEGDFSSQKKHTTKSSSTDDDDSSTPGSLLEKGEKAISSNANAESDGASESLESLGLGINYPKGRRLDIVEKKLEALTPGVDKLEREIERQQREEGDDMSPHKHKTTKDTAADASSLLESSAHTPAETDALLAKIAKLEPKIDALERGSTREAQSAGEWLHDHKSDSDSDSSSLLEEKNADNDVNMIQQKMHDTVSKLLSFEPKLLELQKRIRGDKTASSFVETDMTDNTEAEKQLLATFNAVQAKSNELLSILNSKPASLIELNEIASKPPMSKSGGDLDKSLAKLTEMLGKFAKDVKSKSVIPASFVETEKPKKSLKEELKAIDENMLSLQMKWKNMPEDPRHMRRDE